MFSTRLIIASNRKVLLTFDSNSYKMLIVFILLGIVVVLGLFLMSTYNKLVRMRNGAEEAFESINVFL